MSQQLLLASSSPARLKTLRAAGIATRVLVSHVDEEEVLRTLASSTSGTPSASEQVSTLAEAKGRAVLAHLSAQSSRHAGPANDGVSSPQPASASSFLPGEHSGEIATEQTSGSLLAHGPYAALVACDSMFEMDHEVVGKPHTPETARERLHKMSGNAGDLHTGHWVYNFKTGEVAAGVSRATVHIAELTDEEIEAYIATGEPLAVAGSFTIDGFGGPFVERIEGDHHGVVGISLPRLRSLLTQVGLSITDFWDSPAPQQ
ncbi:MAG: Maf family protein [Actinomycetaceae bacterium]|nr:Maf family nucleotide pyrophosphatase [Arcanobacterium sp.]MDD7504647.1 Maf family protein [Actinomycetaceae bacterium]